MRRAYYHYYHLVHDQNPRKVLDGLHLIFVELPKFKPGNLAEKKMQVLWLRFLTELDAATAERDAAVEKLHQTVRQMRSGGIALEMIAKFTGLTVAEIEAV